MMMTIIIIIIIIIILLLLLLLLINNVNMHICFGLDSNLAQAARVKMSSEKGPKHELYA